MEVLDGLELNGVAEEILVDECLDGRVGEEVFVVGDETVVHIAVVVEMEVSVVEKVVVELLPSMFNESDGKLQRAGGS